MGNGCCSLRHLCFRGSGFVESYKGIGGMVTVTESAKDYNTNFRLCMAPRTSRWVHSTNPLNREHTISVVVMKPSLGETPTERF